MGAFNGLGLGTIAPGSAVRVAVWFRTGYEDHEEDFSDVGAVYVSGDPAEAGQIMTDEQTKVRFEDGRIQYEATFHNLDTERSVAFTMQGGGFV
jgi:hypothetical protein